MVPGLPPDAPLTVMPPETVGAVTVVVPATSDAPRHKVTAPGSAMQAVPGVPMSTNQMFGR